MSKIYSSDQLGWPAGLYHCSSFDYKDFILVKPNELSNDVIWMDKNGHLIWTFFNYGTLYTSTKFTRIGDV